MKKKSIALLIGVFFSICTSFVVSAKDYVFTVDGIGDIKVGTKMSSLPKQVSGLYDKIEFAVEEVSGEGGYEDTVHLYRVLSGREVVLKIYPDKGKVNSIDVVSKRIKTANGLSLASTASELFAAGAHAVAWNDGSVCIVCDGVLFLDQPLSKTGMKKAEQAYLGENVKFEASDFTGNPGRINTSEWWKEIVNTDISFPGSKTDTLSLILGILFIAVMLAIIAHMVYVNYFRKEYPETLPDMSGSADNNAYVKEAMDNLYNVEFTPYCDPNETPGPDVYNFPIGRKSAYHAKEVLDEVYANHLPVDGEAAEDLRKVSIVTNEAFKRTFAGSWKYLIITAIIGVCSCLLNSDLTPLPFFSLSCVLYYFSCRTPNYVLMKKDLKALKSGRVSSSLTNGLIAGIFGLAASAPVYVTVIKNRNTGEVLSRDEDHSMTVVGLAIMVILFIILAMFMMFIGIFNYLRNYVLRK